ERVVAGCASLISSLLRNCPGLRVVATSREPLGVEGEVVWRIGPLADGEAMRLFAARAGTRQAHFRLSATNVETVADICRRMDGLPLAIELAAACSPRVDIAYIAARLSPRRVLDLRRSRGAPVHQRSLRATLNWSFALLNEAERALLRRVAVFVGGWTLEAA